MRLTLINTAVPGLPGSMQRYADLVCQAMASLPADSRPTVTVATIAPGREALRRCPGPIANWLHHAICALRVRGAFLRSHPDVVHILDGSHVYLANLLPQAVPVVATVHDLIPLLTERGDLPGPIPSLPARLLWRCNLRGLRRCSRLVAVSESTRRDTVRLSGLALGRVDVLHNALCLHPPPGAHRDGVAVRHCTPAILHVGHNGVYKNREAVLRVGALVCREVPIRLVLAGPPPTAALRRLATELGLETAAEWQGGVSDAELLDLYRQAALFLFPSIYEGFGWPPLEAMAAGTPVVCSNTASLPEIVGAAALSAAPQDYAQLARHCLDVLSKPGLRTDLVQRGHENLRRFTLSRFAAGLMDVYRQAPAAL